VGFGGGFGRVVVLERQAGEQFLGFEQLGVGLESLAGQVGGAAFEVLGGNQGQAEDGAGVILLDGQGFVEEVGGDVGLPVVEVEAAPADFVIGVVGMLGD